MYSIVFVLLSKEKEEIKLLIKEGYSLLTLQSELSYLGPNLRFIHNSNKNIEKFLNDPIDIQQLSTSNMPVFLKPSNIPIPRISDNDYKKYAKESKI